MSHQDEARIVVNVESIKQVVDWLFLPELFRGLKTRRGARWKPRMLASAAMLWATTSGTGLVDQFNQAKRIVAKIFRWQVPPGETYQGFVKVLRNWHARLALLLTARLRTLMQQTQADRWETAGYVVFAGDGSRVELSRWQSIEKAFAPRKSKCCGRPRSNRHRQAQRRQKRRRPRCAPGAKPACQTQSHASQAASNEKKRNSPQMWLTLFWHVGTGLPWAWRTGPSDSSERGHLQEMLHELPEKSLVCADAGFVGYDFWSAVLSAGHHFVIRVGANVTLLKQLGCARQHAHTVYLWPAEAARKRQPPLVLRLIEAHDGKEPVYLVTDLGKARLSDRAAATIYAARWGIELFFRTFKQTFGRSKLRSRSAANVPIEMDWSLLALWSVCLLGQRELAASGADPSALSAAAAIRAWQSALRDYRVRPLCAEETLWSRLAAAARDDYDRKSSKTSRGYPRKKRRHAIAPPNIVKATDRQVETFKALPQSTTKTQFTA